MTTRSQETNRETTAYEAGRRLYCEQCHSEIEIVSPCPNKSSQPVFRCCGEPMKPSTGVSVNINVQKS